jgi:hypothetical protein
MSIRQLSLQEHEPSVHTICTSGLTVVRTPDLGEDHCIFDDMSRDFK